MRWAHAALLGVVLPCAAACAGATGGAEGGAVTEGDTGGATGAEATPEDGGGTGLAGARPNDAGPRGDGGEGGAPGDAGRPADDAAGPDGGAGGDGGAREDGGAGHAGTPDGGAGTQPRPGLAETRDRLLDTYTRFLRAHPEAAERNRLDAAALADGCALWARLDPSAQAAFLTLTARLEGSRVGADGASMLSHAVALLRIAGGHDAAARPPGSCGDGEANRLFLEVDPALHAALVATHARRGAPGEDGVRDLADITTYWRDSHDLLGPHAPFDRDVETDDGAPRAQAHFFADPASERARQPLGRMDLEAVVEPFALEVDHDYDCLHRSNALCTYALYGEACLPREARLGTELYRARYGDFGEGYAPRCAP